VSFGPIVLPGVSAAALLEDLERHGFVHHSETKGHVGTIPIVVIELWRWDDKTLHSAVLVRQGDGVRLVTVPIIAFGPTERDPLELAAGAYLGAIAKLEYTGAEPERARLWVKENVANPGAEVTIGDAVFVIEAPETMPGEQYRLTVAARGARP